MAQVYNAEWANSCGSCGGYSNSVGGGIFYNLGRSLYGGLLTYPICSGQLKATCQKCTMEARNKPKNGWLRDGKKNFMACMERETLILDQQASTPPPADDYVPTQSGDAPSGTPNQQRPMRGPFAQQAPAPSSTNKTLLYVGIGAAVLITAVVLLRR
jgi:hypothetical protein